MTYNLLDILSEECIDIKVTACHWLENFKKNETTASDDFIILLYCAAGAKSFTRASVKHLSPTELFILKSNIHENSIQCLCETAFNNFTNFIDFIVYRNSIDFLSNKKFMNIIQTTLHFFVEADRTAYRLVAVVVGTRLMSSALLIDANRKEEMNALKNSLKELGKMNSNGFDKVLTGGRGEITDLTEKKLKIFQRIKTLQKYNFCFKIIFLKLLSSVFEEALRSHEDEVRRHCHLAMGYWINFIKLDYVRNRFYPLLCKLMNDPEDELREKAVQIYLKCLQNNIGSALEAKDLVKILTILLQRALDHKDEIKICALKCLNIIERCEMLSASKVEKILLLIFHEQREVSSQAGYFLHRRILSDVGMTSEKYIIEVVSFLQECPDNCTEEFLVDSLINKSLLLTDWSAWMKLLIEEDSAFHDEIEVEHAMSLMSCTLKIANTGIVPFCRKSKKVKSISSITSRNIETSYKIFLKNIDNLWNKYASKDRIFHRLLKCFRYLSFEEVDEIFILDLTLKFQTVLHESNDDLALCNECAVGFAMFCKNSIRNINFRSSKWKIIEREVEDVSKMLERLCHNSVLKISRKTIGMQMERSIEIAALHSLQDIAESLCWNSLLVDACGMISSIQKRDHKIARLFLIVCSMSIVWISVFFTQKYFENGVVMMIVEIRLKLKNAVDQFFSKLDVISRLPNPLLRKTAAKIIQWLKSIACFMQENDGLPFLMYRNGS